VSTLTVRRALRRDIASVAAIERLAFSDPWPAASFADYLTGVYSTFLIATTRAGDMVGYAIARGAAGQGEVLNLAIHPDHRRRGAGGAILDALLAAVEDAGMHELTLEVRASNTAARALYGGRGFEPVGIRRGYYSRPREDAVVMRVDLPASVAARNDTLQPSSSRFASGRSAAVPSSPSPFPRQEPS